MVRKRFLIAHGLLAALVLGIGIHRWWTANTPEEELQGERLVAKSVEHGVRGAAHLADGSSVTAGSEGAQAVADAATNATGVADDAARIVPTPTAGAELVKPRVFLDGVPVEAVDASGFGNNAARGTAHGFSVADDVGRGASHGFAIADDAARGAGHAVGLADDVGRGATHALGFADDAVKGGLKFGRYLIGGGAAAVAGGVALAKRRKP